MSALPSPSLPPPRRRTRRAGRVAIGIVATLALAAVVGGLRLRTLLRGSLPAQSGERALSGLAGPVRIERDARGVPTIHAGNRLDLARATGFLHAQERFFQMDLLRRRAAGELSELV